METQQLRNRMGLLGCFLAPVLLLTACTSSSDTHDGGAASPSPGRTSGTARNTAGQQEKELTAQARSALGATDSAVASGLERASEGLYTEPGLAAGTGYRLTVVCAGTGTVAIEFAAAGGAAKKPVPCDGNPVRERFTAKRAQRVDVSGGHGATGVIAWRIDRA